MFTFLLSPHITGSPLKLVWTQRHAAMHIVHTDSSLERLAQGHLHMWCQVLVSNLGLQP